MNQTNDTYTSPLAERNASPAMLRLWSPRHKFNTWRRIWLAVAEAMHELSVGDSAQAPRAPSSKSPSARSGSGGPSTTEASNPLVTKEQVEELRAIVERTNPDGTIGITDAEIDLAKEYERELRHDVMAHVHALGDACPKARPIIHLGMTSQDVVCNADLMILSAALRLIEEKTVRVIVRLADAAGRHARRACLGFTHYQPAQPLTVGRRVAQWAHDLATVVPTDRLRFKGLRGATGTQASFVQLLGDDHAAVERLERRVVQSLLAATDPEAFEVAGLDGVDDPDDRFSGMILGRLVYGLTAQTYPRVVDASTLSDLAAIASVLHKIATDIRLLSNRKEIDEPFEDKQIGSSAMPYKRNPMRCERICGLCRFVMNLVGNAYDTAATQWLERTLDDSSNRRLSLPEAFLALDGALDLMHNVASGLIVHEAMVKRNLMAELPFMATENILMACVRLGGDRQEYHEKIRVHAQAAGMRVKQEGLDNDLIERLKSDKAFWGKARGGPLAAELNWDGLMDPMKYIGRSVEQTERFIEDVVEPLREQYGKSIAELGESAPRV